MSLYDGHLALLNDARFLKASGFICPNKAPRDWSREIAEKSLLLKSSIQTALPVSKVVMLKPTYEISNYEMAMIRMKR